MYQLPLTTVAGGFKNSPATETLETFYLAFFFFLPHKGEKKGISQYCFLTCKNTHLSAVK